MSVHLVEPFLHPDHPRVRELGDPVRLAGDVLPHHPQPRHNRGYCNGHDELPFTHMDEEPPPPAAGEEGAVGRRVPIPPWLRGIMG